MHTLSSDFVVDPERSADGSCIGEGTQTMVQDIATLAKTTCAREVPS